MLKADLHIHTKYSMDCDTSLEDIIARCQKTGINCIAVSDHGTTEGALKMKEIAPFKVIVAEEILTPYGEIMGLFLKETIPSGSSVEETLAAIKAQGGLACLPHPFDPLRGFRLNGERLDEVLAHIDVIEGFNAREPFPWQTRKIAATAQKYGLPMTAGSDAHTPAEIGPTYVEMPDFTDARDFLQALKKGKMSRRKASLFVHLSSSWAKFKKAAGATKK